MTDVRNLFNENFGSLNTLVESISSAMQQKNHAAAALERQEQNEQTVSIRCIHARPDEEGLFFTPHDFKTPNCDAAKFFRFWHFGQSLPVAIGPFKILHGEFYHELSLSNRQLLSKAATVMNRLEDIHFDNPSNLGIAITSDNAEQIRESSMSIMIHQLYSDKLPRNWQSLSYTTLCKKISMTNPNKKKRSRHSAQTDTC
jgi:hypothetical protein